MYFASLDFKGSQKTTYPYSRGKRDCCTNCLSKTALKKKKAVNKETELMAVQRAGLCYHLLTVA